MQRQHMGSHGQLEGSSRELHSCQHVNGSAPAGWGQRRALAINFHSRSSACALCSRGVVR